MQNMNIIHRKNMEEIQDFRTIGTGIGNSDKRGEKVSYHGYCNNIGVGEWEEKQGRTVLYIHVRKVSQETMNKLAQEELYNHTQRKSLHEEG